MRVGAYPGTFDPPTTAHLAIAEAARRQCELDAVDFVVNREPLGKVGMRSLDDRVRMLEAVAATRRWLRVVITEQRHLADIGTGYDVLILGADKWAQVLDPSFYDSEAHRDAAVARLPQLALAPRGDGALPPECVILEIAADLESVSSTAARAGRLDVIPAEVRDLLDRDR